MCGSIDDAYRLRAELRAERESKKASGPDLKVIGDTEAFRSSSGISLSDAQKDQLIINMSVYLANELNHINAMIVRFEARKKKVVSILESME